MSDQPDISVVADAINRHGYGLQYATYAALLQARKDGLNWAPRGLEVPYALGDRDGRIDLVLELPAAGDHLAIEFKRVNPAYSSWVFARAPRIASLRAKEEFIADRLSIHSGDSKGTVEGILRWPLTEAYHVSFAVKTPKPGDPVGGSDLDAIEKAVSQACAGANGLIEHWVHRRPFPTRLPLIRTVIPVVVTTAEIYVVNKGLDESDLATGRIDLSASGASARNVVYFQYPVSPGIRTAAANFHVGTDHLQALLDSLYVRTVPIVRSTYLCQWLSGEEGSGIEWASARDKPVNELRVQ